LLGLNKNGGSHSIPYGRSALSYGGKAVKKEVKAKEKVQKKKETGNRRLTLFPVPRIEGANVEIKGR